MGQGRTSARVKWLLGVCVALILAAGLGFWAYGRLIQYEPGDTVAIDFAASPDRARSEVGLLTGRGDFYVQQCCAHSFAHPVVNGAKAALFTVGVDDPHVKGNFRSEARLLSNRLGRPATYSLVSATAASWPRSDQRVIVAQWHGADDFFLLEPGRYPPLELAIEGDRWVILKAWDTRLRSTADTPGSTEGRQLIGSAPFSPGSDVGWRFEVLWSTGANGYVRAYKDGRLVAHDCGPNALRDYVGPYMKFGVYVPEWKKEPDRVIGRRQVLVRSVSMAQR